MLILMKLCTHRLPKDAFRKYQQRGKMILRDEITPYIRAVFSFSRYISKIIKEIKKWFIQKFYNKISSFYLPQ